MVNNKHYYSRHVPIVGRFFSLWAPGWTYPYVRTWGVKEGGGCLLVGGELAGDNHNHNGTSKKASHRQTFSVEKEGKPCSDVHEIA